MKIPIIKNTVTNYLSMAVKLIQGILITRYLIAYLGQDYYGLWSLLWSFFCYSVLLDFGFGVTAQKITATGMYKNDIEKYNRTISTIMFFHIVMTVFILLGTFIASFFIVELLHLEDASPEKVAYCRLCFLLFGVGSALVFPFGIFPEMLVGLHKIYLRNNITVCSKILELAGFLLIFLLGGDLVMLIIYTMLLTGASQLVMYPMIKRSIPQLTIRLLPDRELFNELFHFSSFAYLSSMARLIWGRGCPIVISIFCGLDAVAVYQIGGRLPSLMNNLTGPYQENVAPLAASLHAEKRYSALSLILLNSMRWNSFLATGMALGIFIFAAPLLRFLFAFDSAESVLLCRIIVCTIYVGLVFRGVPERYFMMTGKHRFISILVIAESILLVLLAALLLPLTGIVTVAILALSIKLAGTFLLVIPHMIRDAKIKFWSIIRDVVLRPAIAALPCAAVLTALLLCGEKRAGDFMLLLTAGIFGMILYPAGAVVFILNRTERRRIWGKIMQRFTGNLKPKKSSD